MFTVEPLRVISPPWTTKLPEVVKLPVFLILPVIVTIDPENLIPPLPKGSITSKLPDNTISDPVIPCWKLIPLPTVIGLLPTTWLNEPDTPKTVPLELMFPEDVMFVTSIEGWPCNPSATSAVWACDEDTSVIISWEDETA